MENLQTKEAKLYPIDSSIYPKDRYRHHRRYIDENDNEIPETYEKFYFSDRSDDILFKVSNREKNKIDLIAALTSVYDDEDLWWVIAEANDIYDPFDLPVGKVLKIPSKTKLHSSGGILG